MSETLNRLVKSFDGWYARDSFTDEVGTILSIKLEVDVRIAELTAERDRLRDALTEIVKSPWQGSCDYVKSIARNALKEQTT